MPKIHMTAASIRKIAKCLVIAALLHAARGNSTIVILLEQCPAHHFQKIFLLVFGTKSYLRVLHSLNIITKSTKTCSI